MPSYYVEILCGVSGVSSDSKFEARAVEVAAALFALENGAGARFASRTSDRALTFGYSISALTSRAAMREALVITRTALHAAGGATPNWPSDFPIIDKSATRERELLAR